VASDVAVGRSRLPSSLVVVEKRHRAVATMSMTCSWRNVLLVEANGPQSFMTPTMIHIGSAA
jgi:hypothetical protein